MISHAIFSRLLLLSPLVVAETGLPTGGGQSLVQFTFPVTAQQTYWFLLE
jgi:hypothetical protein